jgi:surface protein
VSDMSYMFSGAKQFNRDIGRWDVSNASDMSHMFDGARQFNQDIGRWDVSSVRDMRDMFLEHRAIKE